jgi:hypothetical protein
VGRVAEEVDGGFNNASGEDYSEEFELHEIVERIEPEVDSELGVCDEAIK